MSIVTSISIRDLSEDRLIEHVARESIVGEILFRNRRFRNRLLKNFFEILYAIIGYTTVTLVDDGGGSEPFGVNYDFNNAVPRMLPCPDTSLIAFNAYNCSQTNYKTYWQWASTYTMYEEASMVWLEFAATYTIGGSSSLLFFHFLDASTQSPFNAAISHVLVSFSANDVVKHRIGFAKPWLKNFATLLFASMINQDVGTVLDIAGTSFTPYGSVTPFAGAANIAIGTSNASFSLDDYALQNIQILTTSRQNLTTDSYAEILLRSLIVPDTDIDVGEVGLVLTAQDPNGNKYTVLIARYPLTSIYTMKANHTYVINFKIYYVP